MRKINSAAHANWFAERMSQRSEGAMLCAGMAVRWLPLKESIRRAWNVPNIEGMVSNSQLKNRARVRDDFACARQAGRLWMCCPSNASSLSTRASHTGCKSSAGQPFGYATVVRPFCTAMREHGSPKTNAARQTKGRKTSIATIRQSILYYRQRYCPFAFTFYLDILYC